MAQPAGTYERSLRRPGRRAPDMMSKGQVIYYFAAPDSVYCIAVYAKNDKENLSDAEKQALAKILRPIKQQEH
jgi:hypothetical protein